MPLVRVRVCQEKGNPSRSLSRGIWYRELVDLVTGVLRNSTGNGGKSEDSLQQGAAKPLGCRRTSENRGCNRGSDWVFLQMLKLW